MRRARSIGRPLKRILLKVTPAPARPVHLTVSVVRRLARGPTAKHSDLLGWSLDSPVTVFVTLIVAQQRVLAVSSDTYVQLHSRRFLADCAERLYHEHRRRIDVLDCLGQRQLDWRVAPSARLRHAFHFGESGGLASGSYGRMSRSGDRRNRSRRGCGHAGGTGFAQRLPLLLLSTLPIPGGISSGRGPQSTERISRPLLEAGAMKIL